MRFSDKEAFRDAIAVATTAGVNALLIAMSVASPAALLFGNIVGGAIKNVKVAQKEQNPVECVQRSLKLLNWPASIR